MNDTRHSTVTDLLAQVQAGNHAAFDELLPLVYEELHGLDHALLAMRQIQIDYARGKKAQKRGGDRVAVTFDEMKLDDPDPRIRDLAYPAISGGVARWQVGRALGSRAWEARRAAGVAGGWADPGSPGAPRSIEYPYRSTNPEEGRGPPPPYFFS